jgi:ribosomal protein S18 acetylase RimI-like enzyme
MKVEYRRAHNNDFPAISLLWWEMQNSQIIYDQHYYRNKGMSDCIELCEKHLEMLINNSNCLLFVAIYSDEIIGYILANIRELPPIYVQKAKIEVDSVSVNHKYRRKGVFSGLLECVVNEAKNRSVESIELFVDYENPNKQAYLKSGFKVRQEIMVKCCN